MKSLLFVCSGNICRSPLAEAIARHQLRDRPDIEIDSAGLERYHVGQPPDPRAVAVARQHGLDASGLRARQITAEDLQRFDRILVADQGHFDVVSQMQRDHGGTRPELILAAAGIDPEGEVPDPYYADQQAFDDVYKLLERAMPGIIEGVDSGSCGSSA